MKRVQSYNRAFTDIKKVAEQYADFERIYMPYSLDFRGRIYCASILSPQGADYVKGLLQFADVEPIGKDGIKWLKLHAANLMGDDKAPFDDRIQWADDHWLEMASVADEPFNSDLWKNADKPLQAYATCLEVAGVIANGENHLCRVPVALDGSCSGLQVFSALLHDEIGGAAVNLVPSDKPEDIYTRVLNKVQEQIDIDVELKTDDLIDAFLAGANSQDRKFSEKTGERLRQDVYAYWNNSQEVIKRVSPQVMKSVRECARYASKAYHSKQWKDFGINRNTAKRPVMTFPYGAKRQGFKDQIFDDILKPAHIKQIEKHGEAVKGTLYPNKDEWFFDGSGYGATDYLAGLLWDGVSSTVLKAAEMMEWLRVVAGLAVKDGIALNWVTPLGFKVMQDYRKMDTRRVKCQFSGKEVKLNINDYVKDGKFVTEAHKADLDTLRSVSGISPNIIHSLDSSLLMLIVNNAKKEGIDHFALIHDSFGTTAAKTERFYHIIRESFIQLFTKFDVLNSITNQLIEQVPEELRDQIPQIPTLGKLDLDSVAKSVYCFL